MEATVNFYMIFEGIVVDDNYNETSIPVPAGFSEGDKFIISGGTAQSYKQYIEENFSIIDTVNDTFKVAETDYYSGWNLTAMKGSEISIHYGHKISEWDLVRNIDVYIDTPLIKIINKDNSVCYRIWEAPASPFDARKAAEAKVDAATISHKRVSGYLDSFPSPLKGYIGFGDAVELLHTGAKFESISFSVMSNKGDRNDYTFYRVVETPAADDSTETIDSNPEAVEITETVEAAVVTAQKDSSTEPLFDFGFNTDGDIVDWAFQFRDGKYYEGIIDFACPFFDSFDTVAAAAAYCLIEDGHFDNKEIRELQLNSDMYTKYIEKHGCVIYIIKSFDGGDILFGGFAEYVKDIYEYLTSVIENAN